MNYTTDRSSAFFTLLLVFHFHTTSVVANNILQFDETCSNVQFQSTDCPHHLSRMLETQQYGGMVSGDSSLTLSQLANHEMVANITVDMGDIAGEGNGSDILELSLNVSGQLTDRKCFTILHLPTNKTEQRNTQIHFNCIKMIPEPSSILTSRIFRFSDVSCDCAINNVTGSSVMECKRQCPIILQLYNVDFKMRKEYCQFWKMKNRQIWPTLNIRANRLPLGDVEFEVESRHNNPWSDLKVLVFPNDLMIPNPQPLVDSHATPDMHGSIYLMFRRETGNYTTFYAGLSVLCPEEVLDHDEYYYYSKNTDIVDVKVPLPVHTTPQTDKVKGDNNGTLEVGVVYGVVAGSLCLVAAVFWVFIYKRIIGRSQGSFQDVKQSPRNNTVKVSQDTISLLETENSDRCIQFQTSNPKMLLFHPDSEAHVEDVRCFVQYLKDTGVIVRLPEDHVDNWRAFAESAGDVFPEIIIVLSPGLYKLCELYRAREGTSSKEWEELCRERNGEFSPCAVLDKLSVLYYDKRINFYVHIVVFKTIENYESILCKFMESNCSFLRTWNTTKYVISEDAIKHTNSVLDEKVNSKMLPGILSLIEKSESEGIYPDMHIKMI